MSFVGYECVCLLEPWKPKPWVSQCIHSIWIMWFQWFKWKLSVVLAVWENRSYASLLPPKQAAGDYSYTTSLTNFCIFFTEKPKLTHLTSSYMNPCSLSFWGRLRFSSLSYFLIKTQIIGWGRWELKMENLGQAWTSSSLCVKCIVLDKPDSASTSWRSWERFKTCSAHSRIRSIV